MWKDDKSDIIQQYMHRIDEVASPVILDLMNLKYFVDFGRPQSNNYREVYRFMHPRGQCFVYERKSVLPRAFVVARAQLPPPGTTVLDALPLINPKEYCLVEDEPFEGAAAYQPLDIERDGPADITMKFTITQPGVAVISQSWHPDWCATDNGQPVKVRCVNHNFVGVALPPGEHTLRVWYWPWDFYVGLGVSVLGILTIALVTVLAHHRKRSTADQTVTVSIGAS